MEVKAWEYDEYPGLTEEVEGAVHIPTTGDEPGAIYQKRAGKASSMFCVCAGVCLGRTGCV